MVRDVFVVDTDLSTSIPLSDRDLFEETDDEEDELSNEVSAAFSGLLILRTFFSATEIKVSSWNFV